MVQVDICLSLFSFFCSSIAIRVMEREREGEGKNERDCFNLTRSRTTLVTRASDDVHRALKRLMESYLL